MMMTAEERLEEFERWLLDEYKTALRTWAHTDSPSMRSINYARLQALADVAKHLIGERDGVFVAHARSIFDTARPDPDFKCGHCGSPGPFLEGPHGGGAINFACPNCWARYNDLWPFSIERHGFVQPHERIAFNGQYTPRKLPF